MKEVDAEKKDTITVLLNTSIIFYRALLKWPYFHRIFSLHILLHDRSNSFEPDTIYLLNLPLARYDPVLDYRYPKY